MKIKQGQEFYLTESLQQHPSAFIIFDKDLKIKWMNNSSKYIFTCKDSKDLLIKGVFSLEESKKLEEANIASSFESNIEIQLRKINLFLRSKASISSFHSLFDKPVSSIETFSPFISF